MSGPFKMKNHKLSASAKYGTPIEYASPMKDRPTTTTEKIKAGFGTASDIFNSQEPITSILNVNQKYKENKAYQRALSDKEKKNNANNNSENKEKEDKA
tara:strand:+ start:191 stop:487 length:297 start_codon:yes stop_codon:yes gene_type:complete